jgi:hypothetical protein
MGRRKPGFDCYEVGCGFVLIENERGGFYGGEAGLAEAGVAAVVEEEVGGAVASLIASDAAGDAGGYGGGVYGLPVLYEEVPLDGGEAQLTGDAEDGGAACPVGGTEVVDGGAEGVFEGFVAGGELFADAGFGLPGEPGVGHGVVADEVAGGGYGSGDVGTLKDVAADHEEGGAGVVAGEKLEEALGGVVVGAVVVGEGYFVGVGRGYEDLAEELGLSGEGGVDAGPCSGCGGEEGCRGDGGSVWHGDPSSLPLYFCLRGVSPPPCNRYKSLYAVR